MPRMVHASPRPVPRVGSAQNGARRRSQSRSQFWNQMTALSSAQGGEIAKLPDAVLNRVIQAVCFPA